MTMTEKKLKQLLHNTDAKARRAAADTLDDEQALCRIARCDSDEQVRRAAVRRIKDEKQLYEIAAQEACPDVRWAAIRGIKDPAHLKAAALKETDGFIQDELMYDIDDPDVNARYAKTAKWMKTREKAAKRLLDQELLYAIFTEADRHGDTEEYEWESLAIEAFERISEEGILKRIAGDRTLHGSYRARALSRINDPEFCDGFVMDACETVAAAAAKRAGSQELLMKAAYSHPHENVRSAAILRLDNQRLILVAENHPEAKLRLLAMRYIKEMPQDLACGLALEDSDPLIRTFAMCHVKSRRILFFAALHDPEPKPAWAAYQHIEDCLSEDAKWRILKEAANREPRYSVIHWCRTKEMLEYAAENDPDETVRGRARERLKYEMYE